jgi:cell wall-associated NlpC family hydrolase
VALSTAAAAAFAVLPAQVSQAEPKPSVEQVQQRLDSLNAKIETASEEYNGARLALAEAKRKSAVIDGRLRAAQAQLDSVKRAMGTIAAAAYRAGGTDQFVQLVTTSNPQTFLDRAAGLERIANIQASQMAAAATARHRVAAVQAEAAAQQSAQAKVANAMAQQKSTIQSALNAQQSLLSSLKADEQHRLEALRQARLRAAAVQAAAARASRSRSAATSQAAPSATYNGPASGRAAVAVKEAYAKLGSPYEWAAAGPDRFDCSGLTMWVWGKAGVSLPHQSRAQYAGGRKVAKSDLQPGDLTFYGSPIHHVGIYIGNGQMISAPQTGDVVKIQNALRSDYVGAVRP